ncbi:hypothetical protein SY83_09950 [Paenibacillus swuensis]|uniref:LamG-like jellyroll fold domain-containing protein n=1 Tax=Paenibacillus swuensis TaxID=1178515 RepID=A0A172TP51_9BACL|nr:hypothetical protein SY83_09950 [Paenibacillus swuensis]
MRAEAQTGTQAESRAEAMAQAITNHPALLSFWDFQEEAGSDRVAKGPHGYRLREMDGPIARADDGVFGPYAADMTFGQWFNLPRAECPALNFHGLEGHLTLIAWVKRAGRVNTECQAIAGMWNESNKKRQYCMFMDLSIWDSADQVCGHVSSVGGPTPGYIYCMTTAIGGTAVSKEEWHAIAFTYDGVHAKVYLDGELDPRKEFNPYLYDGGLFDGGEDGADFTVGSVDRSGEAGNRYVGLMGGLAVFNQALTEDEIRSLSKH